MQNRRALLKISALRCSKISDSVLLFTAVKNAWLMFLSPCQWPENRSPSCTKGHPETARTRGVFVRVCVCVCVYVCVCVHANYLSAWPQISIRRRAIACGSFSHASISALHSGRKVKIYEYRMIIVREDLKRCPTVTLSITNSLWIALELKPDLCRSKTSNYVSRCQ